MPERVPDLVRSFETLQEVPGIRADLRKLVARNGDAEFVEAAVLAATELLNNCVLHTDDRCRLAAWVLSPIGLRVEVDDCSSDPAGMAQAPRTEGGGRGLQIVHALATTWGVEIRSGGKTVWFEMLREHGAQSRRRHLTTPIERPR
jgi:hypothetical protein